MLSCNDKKKKRKKEHHEMTPCPIRHNNRNNGSTVVPTVTNCIKMVGIGHCRIFARSNVILNVKTNIKYEPKWPQIDIVEEQKGQAIKNILHNMVVG